MYFLLPQRPVTDPLVVGFRQTLSQATESNYHNIPLYNLREPIKEDPSLQPETKNESKLAVKAMPNALRKSNVATKSKSSAPVSSIPVPPTVITTPVVVSIPIVSIRCLNCGWTFPDSMLAEDRDLHTIRCRNGYGEQDQMVWIRCKGNKSDYRNKFDDYLPKKKPEKEKVAEKEKAAKMAQLAKRSGAKSASHFAAEGPDDSEMEAKKIKKKKENVKETKPAVDDTKKRKMPGKDSAQVQSDKIVREDLKKVKKHNPLEPTGKPNPMLSKSLKSAQNKVVSLPKADGLVFDPTKAFSDLSKGTK